MSESDGRKHEELLKEIKRNGGYCPCRPMHNKDTLCPCVWFRKDGECICGLYKSVSKKGETK